jgi:enoyl-CoA hydratase/carnithine racemase
VVNQVTAAGAALDEALALAERLNERAPNALASIKELMNDAPRRDAAAPAGQRTRALRRATCTTRTAASASRLPGQAEAAVREAGGPAATLR